MATHPRGPHVELVVLLASTGRLHSLATVLSDLPTTFPAAIMVQQHLAPYNSVLRTILGRGTALPVDWAHDGQVLAPGPVARRPARQVPESHTGRRPPTARRARSR